MSRSPSFVGVILAAGESSRMGQDKALLPWRGRTFLENAILSFSNETDLVIVVTGKNTESLKPTIYACGGAFLAVNSQPENGQLSSLQVGLGAVLDHGRDAALVTLVDRPVPAQQTVALIRSHLLAVLDQDKWAVIPDYQGKHGHPIAVSREMMEAFLRAPLSSTARDVEHANQAHIEYLPVNDPNIVMNINTPQEYEAALQTGASIG